MGVELCLEIEGEVLEKRKSMYVQGKKEAEKSTVLV
jgi:hypothetical protein